MMAVGFGAFTVASLWTPVSRKQRCVVRWEDPDVSEPFTQWESKCEKWRILEAWWRNVQKCRGVKNGEWSVVKWRDVMWCDDLYWNVLSLIYSYVAVCRFCAVRCVIICFYLLFSNHMTYVFLIFILWIFCFVFLFSILCILCFCIFCVLFLILYIAVPFLFSYKFNDHCHRVETQLQSINITSYHTS
jgi:hypothetical protein